LSDEEANDDDPLDRMESAMKQVPLCIFGEVLFDHFPDGKRVLGGAPFNVAWHLQAFGLVPRFISRIGTDAEGESVLGAMRDWGMDTQAVQLDNRLPTGRVSVQITDDEPSYDIVTDCAYDAIGFQPELIPAGSFIYHGTLAIRSAVSRLTLDAILRDTRPAVVFLDVNLRPPWWDPDTVMQRVIESDWVKLNTDELDQLGARSASDLMVENNLSGLILTLGGEGAEAWTSGGEKCIVRPGAGVRLVDTVGAGDAFTSVMILGIISRWTLPVTLERAQTFASLIVGQRGATVSDRDFYAPLLEAWDLPPATSG
jgi:fructokinase